MKAPTQDMFHYLDSIGPRSVVYLADSRVGLKAIVVIDNIAAGPSIGGIRMAEDAGLDEVVRLARAMTLKNAAAGLAHGGGKAIIMANPNMPLNHKELLIRAFARGIKDLHDYIPGPDMGTDETCMGWIHDEIGRAVGLPRELGGIPLDTIGATGFGLLVAVEAAKKNTGIGIEGATLAVQGFGAVGKNAARFFVDKGAKLVAVADSRATVSNKAGLDLLELFKLKESGKSVADYASGDKTTSDGIIDIECDIWIPAARPDVIHSDNVARLKTKLIPQGANIPITVAAEETLVRRGVHLIPDFVANAGGVICAAVEYHGGSQSSAWDAIAEKISANTRAVFAYAAAHNVSTRIAAMQITNERVRQAMSYRR